MLYSSTKICQKGYFWTFQEGIPIRARSQIVEQIARKTGFTEAQVRTSIDAMFDQDVSCLRADEKVTIAGLWPL